jgi:L-iditol 2-dehydrogenase
MNTMKAAVFEGVEKISLRNVPIPTCEKEGILVRVEACGICGGDIRNFHNGLRAGVKEQIMGHEIAGVVVKVGRDKPSRFRIGERVAIAPDVSCGECYYCRRGLVNLCARHRMIGTHWPGGFAQFLYLPDEVLQHGFIEPIPENLSFEEAALAEPASSVLACQEVNNIKLGDTVVIIGDGSIGCLHIEVAKARGASRVIIIGKRKLELAAEFGPDYSINALTQNPVEKVKKITNGLGADIVICANPVADTQEQAIEMVRKRGKVILFGGLPKNNPITTLNSNLIHYNELMIIGSFSYPSTGLEDALKMIATGQISAAKYVKHRVSLENVVEGMKYVKDGRTLKVLVKPWA